MARRADSLGTRSTVVSLSAACCCFHFCDDDDDFVVGGGSGGQGPNKNDATHRTKASLRFHH